MRWLPTWLYSELTFYFIGYSVQKLISCMEICGIDDGIGILTTYTQRGKRFFWVFLKVVSDFYTCPCNV